MAERKYPGPRRRRCPSCNEAALVPIFYGPLPDSLTVDRECGNLYWGGLEHHRGSPRWKCLACQQSFPAGAVE